MAWEDTAAAPDDPTGAPMASLSLANPLEKRSPSGGEHICAPTTLSKQNPLLHCKKRHFYISFTRFVQARARTADP
jgi:hypothetical protein